MAESARETSDEALTEIRTHAAVCEKDNQNIKDTLSRQDRMLNWIIGLIITALGAIALLHLEKLSGH